MIHAAKNNPAAPSLTNVATPQPAKAGVRRCLPPGRIVLAIFLALAPLAPSPSNADQASAPIRVMCFNIRYGTANDGPNAWDNRKEVVKQTIKRFQPDLLAAQEVLDFQAEALQEMLPGYEFVGVGRADGGKEGEYSPLLFQRERFELLDSGTFWLSENPEKPGSKSWDSSLPRIATWARLRDRLADRPLLFCSTHFDHRGKVARQKAAELLAERLPKLADGAAIILAGDFNCTEGDAPYRALTAPATKEGHSLYDTYRRTHPRRGDDEATFHGFTGVKRGVRIDWVLCSPDLAIKSAEIDRFDQSGRYPSDHFPVTAVLLWE